MNDGGELATVILLDLATKKVKKGKVARSQQRPLTAL